MDGVVGTEHSLLKTVRVAVVNGLVAGDGGARAALVVAEVLVAVEGGRGREKEKEEEEEEEEGHVLRFPNKLFVLARKLNIGLSAVVNNMLQ